MKIYSTKDIKEQNRQNIYEVVLNEINEVLLDKDYIHWEDFNAEVAIFWRSKWYVVVVLGETGEAENECYSIAIRPHGKEGELGAIEGFYTKGKNPEEIKKTLKKALDALDRYLDTGTTKVPPKKKYSRGDHILSLDELFRQEFVYWHDKITHKGWFQNWRNIPEQNGR